MIFNFFIDLIYSFFQSIFDFLGIVVISDIPYIGSVVSDALYSIITVYNAFIQTLPYAGIAVEVFIYAIVPFEVAMFVLKLILGSRTPNHTY